MMKKTALLFLVSLLCAGGLLAEDAARSKEAAAALKKASAQRRTSFKKPKEVKERIQLEAAESYEKILSDYPGCPAACAEASFRAGEIYRTLRLTDRAGKSFLRTLEFDRKGDFAARSLNEVGHIHRRTKDYAGALAFYRRTLKECAGVRGECCEAATWIGKVHLRSGDAEKGRQALIGFADRFPEFPVAAIRNMDLAAQSFIREGRYVEAAGVVEKCRSRFEEATGRKVSLQRKVEKALSNMKAVEVLEAGEGDPGNDSPKGNEPAKDGPHGVGPDEDGSDENEPAGVTPAGIRAAGSGIAGSGTAGDTVGGDSRF